MPFFLNDLDWLLLLWYSLERDTKPTTYTKTKYPWRQTATKELEGIRRNGQGKTKCKQKNLVESYGRSPVPPKISTINTRTPAINLFS